MKLSKRSLEDENVLDKLLKKIIFGCKCMSRQFYFIAIIDVTVECKVIFSNPSCITKIFNCNIEKKNKNEHAIIFLKYILISKIFSYFINELLNCLMTLVNTGWPQEM